MLSNINYTRYVGLRPNFKNGVFHTNLRASNESGFEISKDKTQMWHTSTPNKKYLIIGIGNDVNILKSIRNNIETVYKGHGYELVKTHKDERLDK
jgi:hypothetical protein|tara:strand:+ start:1131 stop:1415 length:285 start_codon:yes stop_codon:yes gene_type:complete